MKYAENNRISHRQLYHQIILSFLAPLLICIPGYNGEQGLSGAVGIMAAVLILLLYVFFLLIFLMKPDFACFLWSQN